MKKIVSLILILIMVLSMMVIPAYAEKYTEAENQILNILSSLKIMNGDENGNFCLDDYVTRAEFSKMAVAASSYRNSVSQVSRISPFHDVPYTYWGASYIKSALDAGFVKGYPDSTFRPEDKVNLAEGVTIALKLLGYKDESFGTAVWPSGQMSAATDLEILENITCSTYDEMTRRDVMHLFYNCVTIKVSGSSLLSTFGYTYYEDTVFMASINEDSSIPANKILTSNGQFKIDNTFDVSKVGYKGDLVVKNSDTVVAFIPKNVKAGEYTLNAVIEDDVLVYSGSQTMTLDIGQNTDVYYKSQKATLSSISSSISLGDSVTVFKNVKGDTEYVMIGTSKMDGPYVINNTLSYYGIPNDAKVYLNGEKSSSANLETYDIIYYSEPVNTVWAYRKKVIGVYNQANPNKDNPTSINLSGTEYGFETADMYKEFATGGTFNLGDTVTVLLGKSGKIAGVVSSKGTSVATVTGYVTNVGTKTFQRANGDTYTSNYAGLVQVDGTYVELATKKLYSDYKCSMVKATITDSVAVLSLINKTSLTGTFNASTNTIGTERISSNCEFLDVVSGDATDSASYVKVFKNRLDGVKFTAKSVLYYTKNSSGEIDAMFLNDVTGDGHKYGVVTAARGNSFTVKSGTETYNVSGGYTAISENSVVALGMGDNKVNKISKLTKVSSKIKSLDEYTLETSDDTFLVSEKCTVYKNDASGEWQLCSFSDIENATLVNAYYDKSVDAGGRIRVIIIK